MIAYQELTRRNLGYVPTELQEKIRRTRILLAGCGVGSTAGETAVRIGFDKITLADADIVAPHNLNRQCFCADDVGKPKVQGLAQRLRAINPAAEVVEVNQWISPKNAADLVRNADMVFDTIDFLDLSGITALHDECRRQRKPVFSAVSAGFGAVLTYFPADAKISWREAFDLPLEGPVDNMSYVERFGSKLAKLQGVLDPMIVRAMSQALRIMEDGTPCPAPHVSPGAAAVGALAVTAAVRVLAGLPVTEAPKMIIADLYSICAGAGIDLTA
jgi:molybdopterin/thiamine biosynthesis adenylyltransferase